MRLRGSHRATRAQFSFCYTGVWKGAEHSLSKGIYWHETGPVPVTFEKQIIHIMQKRILSCYYARFSCSTPYSRVFYLPPIRE